MRLSHCLGHSTIHGLLYNVRWLRVSQVRQLVRMYHCSRGQESVSTLVQQTWLCSIIYHCLIHTWWHRPNNILWLCDLLVCRQASMYLFSTTCPSPLVSPSNIDLHFCPILPGWSYLGYLYHVLWHMPVSWHCQFLSIPAALVLQWVVGPVVVLCVHLAVFFSQSFLSHPFLFAYLQPLSSRTDMQHVQIGGVVVVLDLLGFWNGRWGRCYKRGHSWLKRRSGQWWSQQWFGDDVTGWVVNIQWHPLKLSRDNQWGHPLHGSSRWR